MILETTGDILSSTATAIVNPVNTKGVMGAGLAAQVKTRYPAVFEAYAAACAAGEVEVGRVFAVAIETRSASPSTPRWIVNLPTKRHWRLPSRLDDVAAGLDALIAWVQEYKIDSVAVPPLGAGLGRLPWDEVRALICEKLGGLDVRVEMYQPLQEADCKPKRGTEQRRTTRTRDTVGTGQPTVTRATTTTRGTTGPRMTGETVRKPRKRGPEDEALLERRRKRRE